MSIWQKNSFLNIKNDVCRKCNEYSWWWYRSGEGPGAAMIREICEEAGLVVKFETVKEYGYVHRIQRSDQDAAECFIQDS